MKTLTSVVKALGEQPEESATETRREDRRRRRGGAGSSCPQTPIPIQLLGGEPRPAVMALLPSGLWSVQPVGSTDWKGEGE